MENVTQSKELPDSFELKRAQAADLPAVWGVISTCARDLSEQGLNHWTKYYTESMVSKMIERKEVYVGLKNGEPVGTITFDTKPPKYYVEPGYSERFTNPEESATYVTAAAVIPREQNHGFASQMLEFVESETKRRGTKWLRLDCRAEVPGLVGFYEKRGYKKLGDEPIDEGEDGTYWLMEKDLQENN